MRGQRQRDLVPTNIDVGMMPRFFRNSGSGVDEFDRRGKIFEDERARDGCPTLLPIGYGRERGFDLNSGQFLHPALMPEIARRVTEK